MDASLQMQQPAASRDGRDAPGRGGGRKNPFAVG
tara:strand:- start:129 stop:230 length:102 start_codon:yes stop_codon:yes gene_type:complete